MLPPINKLPPEVLSAALEHRTDDQDLIAATQVCQYWRSVLTSNRVLWTSFQLQSSRGLDRALAYLERSNPMLIDLTVNAVSLRSFEVFEHLTAHIARTRSFVVENLRDGHTISSLLRNSTPSLQHLDINFRGAHERLPNDFLHQQASSLQSISLIGICPTFESPFPFPNLVQFRLGLPEMACPFRTSALFRFLSGCPQLRRVLIHFSEETLKDIAPDRVISLESLEELEYASRSRGRIIPYLSLPRLTKFRVYSCWRPGQTFKLCKLLPYDYHALLAGVTKMAYHTNFPRIQLTGDKVDLSLTFHRPGEISTPAWWLFDDTPIPFERIEDLTVDGSIGADFPLDRFTNLKVLRVIPWGPEANDGFFRLLHPKGNALYPFLQEIQYTCFEPLGPLVRLAQARLLAGHQLELVRLVNLPESFRDDVEELRGLVEVLIEEEDISQ